MRGGRIHIALLAAAVVVSAGAGVFLAGGARGTSESEQGFLANLISKALSSSATQVHIGSVDGALSSDATIHDVVISDRDGVWLKLDRARLVWRRSALFLRRLEVDRLEIGHLEIRRKPVPSETATKPTDDGPALPDLPVKVQIKAFSLADLDLGKPILGTALRASATGATELGSPSEGLVFDLDAKRLDSGGRFMAALKYVPKGNALSVKVKLDEPAGGLMSTIGHIPGEPPVLFDLVGNGTLDAFKAGLDFQAGSKIDAKGAIDLQRHDAGRDLTVKVGGHLGALLPTFAASIFDGETNLTSTSRIADDGSFALNNLALTSHLARLDAHGVLGADKMMDFETSVRAVPSDGEVSKAGDATIRKLVFDGTMQGPAVAPRIVAKLALADARLPEGSLSKLEASFTATPSGAVTDTATQIALDGRVDASGIEPRDAGLAHAIGGSAVLDLKGTTDTKGRATFQRIGAKTPTLDIAYAGELGRARVHGRIAGQAPDLSQFGNLAGLKMAGTAALGIDLDGAPKYERMDARIVADIAGFSTGIATVDRLAGKAVSLKGSVAQRPEGAYVIDDLTLKAAHVSAHVAGSASPKTGDVAATIILPDLSQADPTLTGHAAVDAHLTGSPDKPDVAVSAAIDRATASGRGIPHLALVASVADLRGATKTRVTLDGSVDGKPAKGMIDLARRGAVGTKPDGWDLSVLDVAIGSVSIKGAGSIDADRLANGRVSLAAGNLDDLSPLALTKLGGSLSIDAALEATTGHQNVSVNGQGNDLHAAGAAVRKILLRFDAKDLYAHPILDADGSIDQAVVGGQAISAVKMSAKGDAASSAIKMSARAAGFDLDAAGSLIPGSATRFALTSFSARRGSRAIKLAGPADFVMAPSAVDIRHLALDLAGGRLTAEGRAGKNLDLTVDGRAIPLAAADIAMPGLGLGGTLDAHAKLGGSASAPIGSYTIAIKRLVAPQTKSAGVPPIDVAATGRLDGHRASVDAKVNAGRAGTVTATGSLPLDPAGSLDLAVHGKLDAAVANAKLGVDGRSVTGSVLVDAKLAGTKAAPKISGGATLSGGTFRDNLLGVRVESIDARIAAQGDRLAVERLSGTTPGGGTLSGSGQIRVDPAAGFPGSVTLRGHDAQLMASSLMHATADFGIDIAGALARNPRVTGRVDVTRVDVGIPDRLPTTLKPIDGIRHVNTPPAATARLALADAKTKAASGTKGRNAIFDAGLDVTISAPNRIFVRGRGVDAELGGLLRVTGTTNKPSPNGAFDLRRGKIVALGKTLTFTKGKLSFTGDLVPELDFTAEIQSTDITAQIAVTGPAAAPQFAFTSSPELPQDEILSRVLFQKSSGNLSGFQALQLAQAAAQFSSGGDGAFEKLRKSLGVDSLDVGADKNGPSVGVSRAISDRVSVGVRTGATADQTGLSADVDVTRHIRVQSDVRSNGAASVGVGSEVEY
jgi:translocation and assembly module TamB